MEKRKKFTFKYTLNKRLKSKFNSKKEELFPVYIQVTYNRKVFRFPYPFQHFDLRDYYIDEKMYLSDTNFNLITEDINLKRTKKITEEVMEFETKRGMISDYSFKDFPFKLKTYIGSVSRLIVSRVGHEFLEFAKDNLIYREYEDTVIKKRLVVAAFGNEVKQHGLRVIRPLIALFKEKKIELPYHLKLNLMSVLICYDYINYLSNKGGQDKFNSIYQWYFNTELQGDFYNFIKKQIQNSEYKIWSLANKEELLKKNDDFVSSAFFKYNPLLEVKGMDVIADINKLIESSYTIMTINNSPFA